jgi:hypothetical protein
MSYGPSPQPGIDAPFEPHFETPFETPGALPPLSRAAMAAVVVAAVLMLGAVTIGAVLLNHDDTQAGSERVAAAGFSFEPPVGWEDNAGKGQEPAALGGDVVRSYRSGAAEGRAGSVIVITAGPPVAAMPDGDRAPGGALGQALVSATRAAGASELGRPRAFTLGGQPAVAIDFGNTSDEGRTTGLRVAALRDGTVYSASLVAPAARYEQDAAAFKTLLGGWAWR